MNPYAITRLYGSLGDIKVKNTQNNDGTIIHPSSNRMYDIRDTRRFYDLNVNKAYLAPSKLFLDKPIWYISSLFVINNHLIPLLCIFYHILFYSVIFY